ncbi:MAG TPA: hypothetical protein VGM95_01200 [Lactobacillaceae bacterium]|jgi:hypothetical protein
MTPQDSVERFFTAYYVGDEAATRKTISQDFIMTGPFAASNSADELFELAQGLMQIVRGHRVLRWTISGNEVAALYEIMIQGPRQVEPLTMAGWFTVNQAGQLNSARLLYDNQAFEAIVSRL